MRRIIGTYLLCVSLVAGTFAPSQKSDPLPAPQHTDALPLSVPCRGQYAVSDGSLNGRHTMLREDDGRTAGAGRLKSVDRVAETARTTLRPRTASELPLVLWAHTCSVSLPERHVRLQI